MSRMKKIVTGIAAFIALLAMLMPAGCGAEPAVSPSASPPAATTASAGQNVAASPTVTADEEEPVEYYIGASCNGYAAKDENYKLSKVDGYDNVYKITIYLTAENADQTYQAHYYKITNGTWAADGCWGLNHYVLPEDKRPVNEAYPTAGMGGIYIPISTGGAWPKTNRELTVYFNSETKAIADSSFYVMNQVLPIVYGNFEEAMGLGANYSLEHGLPLYDADFDGIYEGTYTIPAFEGTAQGYTIYTCLSQQVYYTEEADPQYVVGAAEQVAFEPFKPAADTEVTFRFDIRTKTGTIVVD